MRDDVCPCHGEPWYVFPTRQKGQGQRACHVKKKARDLANKAQKPRNAESDLRYARSEKGRAARSRANERRIAIGYASNGRQVYRYFPRSRFTDEEFAAIKEHVTTLRSDATTARARAARAERDRINDLVGYPAQKEA